MLNRVFRTSLDRRFHSGDRNAIIDAATGNRRISAWAWIGSQAVAAAVAM